MGSEFRIGYCLGSQELMDQMNAVINLMSVGVATCIQKGALEALKLLTDSVCHKVLDNNSFASLLWYSLCSASRLLLLV